MQPARAVDISIGTLSNLACHAAAAAARLSVRDWHAGQAKQASTALQRASSLTKSARSSTASFMTPAMGLRFAK